MDAIARFISRIIFLPVGVVFSIGGVAGPLDTIDPVTGTVGEGFAVFGYLVVGFFITAVGAGVWMKKSGWRFPPRVRVPGALLLLHGFIFFVVLTDVIEKKTGPVSNVSEPLHTMNEIFIMTALVIPLFTGLWILGKKFREEIDPDDPATKQAKELKGGGWVLILCGLYGLAVSRMAVAELYNMAWGNPTFLFLAFMAGLVVLFGAYLAAGFPFGREMERPDAAGFRAAHPGWKFKS